MKWIYRHLPESLIFWLDNNRFVWVMDELRNGSPYPGEELLGEEGDCRRECEDRHGWRCRLEMAWSILLHNLPGYRQPTWEEEDPGLYHD